MKILNSSTAATYDCAGRQRVDPIMRSSQHFFHRRDRLSPGSITASSVDIGHQSRDEDVPDQSTSRAENELSSGVRWHYGRAEACSR